MFGRILFAAILAFSLAGCAATYEPLNWYKRYEIPSTAELTKKESIPKLILALDDESAEIRGYAAERLGYFGADAKDAKVKLYFVRTNDASGSVRLLAHYSLQKIFGEKYTNDYLFFEDLEEKPSSVKFAGVKQSQESNQVTTAPQKITQVQPSQPAEKTPDETVAVKDKTFSKPVDTKPASIKITPGTYYALVIGNNNYRYLPSLKTAVNDAQEVATTLEGLYGFRTSLLLDATRSDIVNSLNLYREQMSPEDNLLIYYAGHGIYDKVAEEAYWLPVDAQEDSDTEWIIVDTITSNLKRIQAKHVLIVADSCYAGTLTRAMVTKLKTEDDRSRYIKKIHAKKSRTLLASGGNEPVADSGSGNHSVFANAFLKGLREMENTIFTAEELYLTTIKEQVAGKSEQMPEYNTIRNSGHDGGDFCFIRK